MILLPAATADSTLADLQTVVNTAVSASGTALALITAYALANNGTAPEFMHKVWDPFLEQVDHRVVKTSKLLQILHLKKRYLGVRQR